MLHKVLNPAETAKEDRLSFAEIDAALEMPDLIEIQKNSYSKFIKEDLGPIIRDFSPIDDFSNSMSLEFLDCYLEDTPKYSIEECKDRDATYAASMRVRVRLTIKNDDGTVREILEQDVFMGDFPLMTPTGTFIINGAERVVASQLVRSPGCYYSDDKQAGKCQFTATLIPNRGAWMEFEIDNANVFFVKVDRSKKVSITALLRALGYGTDEQILEIFGKSAILEATLEHDHQNGINSELDGLVEMYKRIRPGENAEEKIMRDRLTTGFFDSRHYDLARVGRYKFNKKLSLASRIENNIAAEDIVSPDGELLCKKGDMISRELAYEIQNAGVMQVTVKITLKNDAGEDIVKNVRVMSNGFIDPKPYLNFDPKEVGIREYVHYDSLMKILAECSTDEQIKARLAADMEELSPEHLYMSDILASINYMLALFEGFGDVDDIDHLGNRRVRCVGELLQNQLRVGLSRMERIIRERMTSQSMDSASPSTLINIRPVSAVIREFFGSSQLSQFMDQNNPLAELTHKRRLSALGPGGLNRDRPSFEVRDVHHSHYGRMCPIETPEGKNIGLIGSLATYARINEYGFMESPYRRVDKENGIVTNHVDYLAADDEDRYIIAQANEPITPDGHFVNRIVSARNKDDFLRVDISKVDYIDVSPKQVVSVATAMIPFLENDDASRALMGANMQRQAVPLLCTEAPIVGTGIEYKAARDSGVSVLSKGPGVVKYVDADKVVVLHDDGETVTYELLKYRRSNQGTCINQHPIVKKGQRVEYKTTLADGPSTAEGELSLGRNIIIGFTPWNGYNYEDAMLISERLARDDIFTTIHIEEYECEARDTKLGPEEITHDIPNVGEDMRRNLDEEGIIRIGAEVYPGDILVGKVTPKGETDVTAEERLLHAIFSNNAKEVRDTSLRVPHGAGGVVVDIKIFTRENKDELSPGVNKMVRVYLAQKRKVHAGDKMAGRHGNKGVISRVLPEEDMPFLPDGTPLQICLNPLGVPSRMNVGQVLEVHLGIAAKKLGIKIATPVFDGAHEPDIEKLSLASKLFEKIDTLLTFATRLRSTAEIPVVDGALGHTAGQLLEIGKKLRGKDKPEYDGGAIDVAAYDKELEEIKVLAYDKEVTDSEALAQRAIALADKYFIAASKILGEMAPLFGLDVIASKNEAEEKAEADLKDYAQQVFTGKTILYDGRTGEAFDNPITVGCMYMIKLIHMVDDKIHARSTGPYSLVTQQPLGGKAQFGGQRFGEMEVWALEAYGAAHTLQEILTIKSDDVVGRVKAYEAIVKGENVPEPGIPESFKVLLEELRSLALDVKILTEEHKEVEMMELLDDDRDVVEYVSDKDREAPEGDLFSMLGFDEDEDDDGSLELDSLSDDDESLDILDGIEEDEDDMFSEDESLDFASDDENLDGDDELSDDELSDDDISDDEN